MTPDTSHVTVRNGTFTLSRGERRESDIGVLRQPSSIIIRKGDQMMSSKQEPMIKLQPGGSAPIISYNVPEPTAYSGRNFIDLAFPDSYFVPSSASASASSFSAKAAGGETSLRKASFAAEEGASMKKPSSLELFRSIPPRERLSPSLEKLTEEEVIRMEAAGKQLVLYKSMSGALTYRFIDAAIRTEAAIEAGSQPTLKAGLARAVAQPTDEGPLPTMRPIDDGGGGDPDPDPISVAVGITSPAANSTVNGAYSGAVFNVHGWASNSGDGSIAKVQVKIGGGSYQDAQLSDDGSWVFPNVTINTSGSITITAKATHSFGSTLTASKTITVNVALAQAPDTKQPQLSIVKPTPGQFLSTNGASSMTVNIEGTASDDRSLAKVEYALNGGAFQLTDTSNGYANWKKALTLSGGTHSLIVKATDAAGNAYQSSLTFTVDSVAPTLTITAPQQGAQVAGTNSKGAVIEVTGTASDISGIKLVEVALDQNQMFLPATPKGTNDWSTWKATLNVNEQGSHTIYVRCTDLAGIVSEKTVGVNVNIFPEVSSRLKRIILVESFRLSSFLGNYGAGRTIKTTSLLPGEKTKISIRSYLQSEQTVKDASTILDSVTDDIADEFEKSMGNEQTDKKNYEESFKYSVSAEAGASWGWGSAHVSASASGGTNAAREQFARNISNSTQKHVARASARRDVQINTSFEEKTTTGEETAIVREIENINVGRSLNFVFRQMNQEYITLLHLIDIRVGFFKVDIVDGKEDYSYQEVTLPQLDKLISEVIVADKRTEVRNSIVNQLLHIFDYQDRHHRFIEDKPFKDEEGNDIPLSNYLRVKKDYFSTYNEPGSPSITVPGIILAANRHVLRTEGVIVEALLGQGEALDDYSRNLQTETVRERNLKNDLLEQEIKMKKRAIDILDSRDQLGAKLYAMINQAPESENDEDAEAAASSSGGALAGLR